jgi:hypothetical protein
MTKKQIFNPNTKEPVNIDNGDNQPPKNRITLIELIINIFAYSPKEKSAKPIAEYSTL